MLADTPHLAANLRNYIAGVSPNMREVLEKFDLDNTFTRLDEAGLLFLVLQRFEEIDPHPDKVVTHAALKTLVAFLNTEGGDLLIGVADERSIVGLEVDLFENEAMYLLHLSQVVCGALGDRAGSCKNPRTYIVQGKAVCVVSCQRGPAGLPQMERFGELAR